MENVLLPVDLMPGKLAEALSKAQAKIRAPKKNKIVDFIPKGGGPRVKYNYADLADVIEAVTGPLSENGIAVTHKLMYDGDAFGMKTFLFHSSGEFVSTWYPLPDPEKQEMRAQEFGSAISYARRYSLSSLVGIASEEDDDGAGAPIKTVKSSAQPARSLPPPENQDDPGPFPPNEAYPDNEPEVGRPDVQTDPGKYVIKFGKHQKKTIESLGYNVVKSYVEFFEKNAKTSGNPIQGDAEEFVYFAKEFLANEVPF